MLIIEVIIKYQDDDCMYLMNDCRSLIFLIFDFFLRDSYILYYLFLYFLQILYNFFMIFYYIVFGNLFYFCLGILFR